MAKYRKKPVIIEAIKWDGSNILEIREFAYPCVRYQKHLFIETLEGRMRADIGDYIIKGVNGEFYPCKPDVFEKTYEKVADDGKAD